MAAGPEDPADPEPFSPSVFLDLPPTPRPNGSDDDPAQQDDELVLPYISRMLMEEDIDDNFLYQYADHPALLQAQQTFAEILSDAGAATGSDSAAANTNTNTSGSGTFTLSPPSSDAPAFASATWPYDPVELYQLLLSRTDPPDTGVGLAGGDASGFFLPGQDGASAFLDGGGAPMRRRSGFVGGAEQETNTWVSTTLCPAGDGDHAALASAFFSGQSKVNMEMLNLAFLKGMEEANKFLPTNNGLLEATSGGGEDGSVFASNKVKQKEKKGVVVDGMSMFQESGNGRGCKNQHNWDALDVETGRKSKVMAPEPEESGEMVDDLFLKEYHLALERMQGLSITTDSEAEKVSGKSAQGRQSTDEAVDLRTLLIHCAQAVATGNRRGATELLKQIKQRSPPRGDATQRLAHCFAEGLEARLAGTGNQVYRSLMAKRTSVAEFLKAYQLYLAACCFKMMAFKFSNVTICKAIAGRKKVHIVDYGEHHGFQWPTLLGFLAKREGGPPEVRITGIDLPQPGFRPAARVEETGRRLSNFARQCRLPFKFHGIAAKLETVCADDLSIDPDEVLIVNGLFRFGNLVDEGVDIDSPSPRDVVLNNIRKMRPDVFILCVENSSYNSPFFVTRFREALFYYSAMFDMMDATTARDDDRRLLIEQDIFGRSALNVIACEGSDRVERPETYKQWNVRNERAGLRQLPLDPDLVKVIRKKVKDGYHKDFVIDADHQWLLQGWKGRILYAMSTWVAADAS